MWKFSPSKNFGSSWAWQLSLSELALTWGRSGRWWLAAKIRSTVAVLLVYGPAVALAAPVGRDHDFEKRGRLPAARRRAFQVGLPLQVDVVEQAQTQLNAVVLRANHGRVRDGAHGYRL